MQLSQLEAYSHPKYLNAVENLKLKRDEELVEINDCKNRSLKAIEDEYIRDIMEISNDYNREANELKRKLIWKLKRKKLEIIHDRTHMQIDDSVESTFPNSSIQLRSYVNRESEPSKLNFFLSRQEIEEDLKQMKITSMSSVPPISQTSTFVSGLCRTTQRLPSTLGSSQSKTILRPRLRYVPKLSKKRYPKSMDNSLLFTKKSSSNAEFCRAKIVGGKLHFNDRRFKKNDIVILEQISNTEKTPSAIGFIGNDFVS